MARQVVINERYELESLPLARGGMGEVWLGRDAKLDREIAVKFIRFPDDKHDDELVRRFVRESRITARLEHPGVPSVYDVGTHEGRPFLVMQRVRGLSVADLVAEQGSLPVPWAASIAAQVCSVLVAAHQASLVHRDLKPSNLVVSPDGTVKVLDFGLAVALDLADRSQITRSGQSLGTPAYMAPEQVMAAESSPRTDLYTLGCTLHRMLTGQPLFVASTAFSVMTKQVQEPPPSVRHLRSDVPVELEGLILQMLEKQPESRPASAAEVHTRLLPFVGTLTEIPGVYTASGESLPTTLLAAVLTRALTGPAPLETVANEAATGQERAPSSAFGPDEVERATVRADSLVESSRHREAAAALLEVLEPASRALGSSHELVAGLRMRLARAWFDGGEYARAAPIFQRLAIELETRDGPDSTAAFDCRMQEATCHALSGETTLALRQMSTLLRDERRTLGSGDPRVVELRRQIGLLQHGAGQTEAAVQTLTALLYDLSTEHGNGSAMVADLRRTLNRLRDPGTSDTR